MAFTATQKVQVRRYLGYAARDFQTNTVMERAFAVIEADAAVEAEAVAILASLVDVDTKLLDCHKRLKASALGSIRLRESGELRDLKSEGRRFVQRLSNLFGVPVAAPSFGYGDYSSNYVGK